MSAVGFTSGDPRKLNRTGYTQGDVIAADAAGALTAVAVGADTEVLTADSTEPTGVDWEPGGGGGGGGTPSNTVVAETTFGQASGAGASTNYSRGDHTHGTPAAPSVPSAAGTVTSETSFGQASSAGVAATFSRGDHTHGTPAAPSVPSAAVSVVTETSFGQASAIGVGTAYARDDHTHGTPVAPTAASVGADPAGTAVTAVATHNADTTAVHGIVNTANIILEGDPRLTDARTPTAHAASHADGGSDEVTLAQSQITGLVTDLGNKQPLDGDLTTIAGLTPSNDDFMQRKSGAWANRTVAQVKTDLAYTAADVGAIANTLADAKGDVIAASGADTWVRVPVGADGTVLTADSGATAGVSWAAGGGGGSTLVVRRQRYTAGDITLNLGNGAFNLITGPSLAIPAAEGDYVELSLSIMVQSGNAYLDPVVAVGGAAVRYASTDTNASAGEGWPPLYTSPSTFRTAAGLWGFEVGAGDIDGGNVTFRMAMRGTTGTLYGSATYPFYWIVKNYGAVDFA